jgi:hypothetical protein
MGIAKRTCFRITGNRNYEHAMRDIIFKGVYLLAEAVRC